MHHLSSPLPPLDMFRYLRSLSSCCTCLLTSVLPIDYPLCRNPKLTPLAPATSGTVAWAAAKAHQLTCGATRCSLPDDDFFSRLSSSTHVTSGVSHNASRLAPSLLDERMEVVSCFRKVGDLANLFVGLYGPGAMVGSS
jgi:hypothetical protein